MIQLGSYDVAIIGGGIVGIATAMALTAAADLSLIVLEAEVDVAVHQTGHNSGVIHSGLYYRPGSRKAKNCVEGREAMFRFCADHDVRYERCGKIVVATDESELASLDELERRGAANGLTGIQRVGPKEIREREPHATGIAALLVPDTGIVNYAEVTRAMARVVLDAGGRIETSARVRHCRVAPGEILLDTAAGSVRCAYLVNCAGLQSDRVARLCGTRPGVRIVPFRGEYYELVPERRHLVNHLIYPVPDPRFPFLGVHFTRRIDGTVEAGPNAVLALNREGYRRGSLSFRDVASTAGYAGFWRLAGKYWRTASGEVARSWSRWLSVRALQRLVPEIRAGDIRRAGAGVRAQAIDKSGALIDDFHIVEAERMIHVLNAPSPAATASISIGRAIAATATRGFGLSGPANE